MEVISCPNCGRLLQYDTRKENFMIDCPHCGEVPLLEDSRIITISEGKLCGPGLKNLEEKGQELLIYNGKTSFGKIEEESVIEGSQEPALKKDKQSSSNSSQQTEFKAKIPQGTVEENYDIDYSSNKPRSSRNNTRSKREGKTPSGLSQEKFVQNKTPRVSSIKKRPPWQRFALFYGTIGIALLTLIIFTIYKVNHAKKEIVVNQVSAQKLWNQANDYYLQGELCYKEAITYIHNNTQYKEKLKRSNAFYQKALEVGKQSWQQNLQELIARENMTPDEAEEYAKINYGGYQEKMQKWQQEYKKIQESLKSLEKKK